MDRDGLIIRIVKLHVLPVNRRSSHMPYRYQNLFLHVKFRIKSGAPLVFGSSVSESS